MSINLGTAAIEAIKELRTTSSWGVFLAAFEDVVRSKLHAALDSPVENRVDATGYARGLSDLHSGLSAATQMVNPRQVSKLSAKQLAEAS